MTVGASTVNKLNQFRVIHLFLLFLNKEYHMNYRDNSNGGFSKSNANRNFISSAKPRKAAKFGGKTIDEWELEWRPVKGGFAIAHNELLRSVGLYRAVLNGQIVYIGRGVQTKKHGLYTRLLDFQGKLSKAGDHYAGRKIWAHQKQLKLEILDLGWGWASVKLTMKLRPRMVARHRPEWNRRKSFKSVPSVPHFPAKNIPSPSKGHDQGTSS